MVVTTEPRIEATRFALYLEELRDFARSCQMRVGSSEDVHTLRKALEGPGLFREECASMIRSVVYRERGNVSAEELLALVTSAWGGPGVHDDVEALQEPLRGITIFLAGVMRGPRDSPTSSVRDLSSVEILDPLSAFEYAPPRPQGIFAAAAQAAEAERLEVPVAAAEVVDAIEVHNDLNETLKGLEAESPDVQLYLQLLRQQQEKRAIEAGPAAVLEEQPAILNQSLSAQREDPWDENSELQQELRRFAAEREARAAEHRAAKAARAAHIKILFGIENVLFRLVGPDNFVRRYLSGELRLPGTEHWKV